MEKNFLEGKTFHKCYKEDRLFYIDYKDFEEYVAKASNEVSFLTLLGTLLNMTNIWPKKLNGQLLNWYQSSGL